MAEEEFHMVDLAATEGYLVDDSDEDDPVLITPDGHRVDTWRDQYPYDERMSREEYETTKRALQIELRPGVDVAIPSVAPDMRILSYETTPATAISAPAPCGTTTGLVKRVP